MHVCSEGELEALFISFAAIPVNVKDMKDIQDSVGINCVCFKASLSSRKGEKRKQSCKILEVESN